MNVLLCTACGHRLTEPLRRLPELPERPEPSGAPFVPHPDPDWAGAGIPYEIHFLPGAARVSPV